MPDRRPVAAGRFYSGDPEPLRREVESFLGNGHGGIEPLMFMLPHAGYVYCGSVIGATLRLLRPPSTLVLLGPNHSGKGRALAVWPEGKWSTPLGSVEVDAALATRICEAKTGFEADQDAHVSEHSLEVLLPFLQVRVPDLRIVPVAVSLRDLEALRRAGETLAACVREECAAGRGLALLVSSDMNHYENQERTVQKDTAALAPLLALSPEDFFAAVRGQHISMCGVCPATLALFACTALGAKEAQLAAYATSAAASGDTDRVVGYAGVYVR